MPVDSLGRIFNVRCLRCAQALGPDEIQAMMPAWPLCWLFSESRKAHLLSDVGFRRHLPSPGDYEPVRASIRS